MTERETIRILFVCSMNKWRSPTAEKIYADNPQVLTRSCGTSNKAQRTVNSADLKWADLVLVMEQKHKQRLMADFPSEMRFKQLHVLDVPDNYKFMDAELVSEISTAVEPILADI